jgi:hypothetical protein
MVFDHAVPERAILEMIDELPNHESFHQVDTVIEGLVNLRPQLLRKLLRECKSVKVKRLFLWYADRHGHAWFKHLDQSSIDLGKGKRQPARHGDRMKASSTSEGLFEGLDRGTGEIKGTARAIAEIYASADSKEIFVKDFVAAWNKIINLDLYDPHKALYFNSQTEGLPQGSPSAYPEFAKEIPIRPRSHFSENRVALPSDLGKRLGCKDLNLLNLRRFSK